MFEERYKRFKFVLRGVCAFKLHLLGRERKKESGTE